MNNTEKIIFVDRDGVINVDPIGDYVKSWEDFRFEEGAVDGLQLLHKAGYEIIIISNQAGVGDGVYPQEALEDIHQNMKRELLAQGIPLAGAEYCLHGKKEGCKCRKPEIGLFERALQGKQIEKNATFFIGDKASDMEAGKRFGIKTAFVRTGHGIQDEPVLKQRGLKPDILARNLLEAAKVIIS